ncbi:MAG: peptide chain release factor 1 [Bacteroidetes bacterium]|nr:peptide chain release factor 1 [Bacteroidota bacterium]MBU1580403.1 peptide chain release factor 1 [Bacteroidota bacterium]MBU2465706.1 peptide chain release factor 1 [Bacteroidota bacterium]MBU2556182.1 peptide chain release factor 1 [Bacteroidota bacterium]
MIDKLETIRRRWEEMSEQLNDPAVMADMKRYVKLNKDYKDLEPVIQAFTEYKTVVLNIGNAREIIKNEKDEDFREMAREELETFQARKEKLEEDIRIMLIPKDPQDDKNAVVEIRAGTGGDEASIFAGDLYRMYIKYCETKGWKTDVVDMNEGTAGGFKEVVFNVTGNNAYGILKFESGVHRVQRVPKTETQGRVHTSAASVVVLPEAEEFDIELLDKDIRKDTYCSSGPGGQSVNTTYSAIRLTHIPSGIVVTCQDEKSQLKNLAKAMKVLRTRLFEVEYSKYLEEISSKRKTMVSTGDRSAKIRTYNWPQGRVTDHRINLTLYNLSAIIDGDLDEIIEKLQIAENAERLKTELDN